MKSQEKQEKAGRIKKKAFSFQVQERLFLVTCDVRVSLNLVTYLKMTIVFFLL